MKETMLTLRIYHSCNVSSEYVKEIAKDIMDGSPWDVHVLISDQDFEETMLEKYPNLSQIRNCHQCGADLRYLKQIHRIDYEWYCNKCFKKYKGEKK